MDEESTAVNTTEVVDTSPTESAAVETTESTGDELDDFIRETMTDEEPEEKEEEEDTHTEPDDTAEVTEEGEDTAKEQSEPTAADRRKDQLNTEIRDMVAQKNQLAKELEQYQQLAANLQQQQAQERLPQNVEEYLNEINPDTGEYFTPQEAQLNLMAQKLQQMETERQQERHIAEVRTHQAEFTNEIDKVLRDFPEFDAESDKFNPELSERMDAILQANLIIDPVTRQPIGSHTPLYQLYKTISDSTQLGSRLGAQQQQRANSKMLQSVDVAGGSHNSTLNEGTEESRFIDSFFK